MTLPNLPSFGSEPWYNARTQFDEAVKGLLEPTDRRVLKSDGTLPPLAAANVQTMIDSKVNPLAALTIVGAGRPDIPATMTPEVAALVSSATSGAVFRSTDGPQGAWEWQKRGTSWVVTSGDTGWRDVLEWMTSSFVTASSLGRLQARRTPNAVLIEGRLAPAESIVGTSRGAVQTLASLPVGWRAQSVITYSTLGHGRVLLVGPIAMTLEGTTTILVRDGSGTWAASDFFTFTTQIGADDRAWPTTLPGA